MGNDHLILGRRPPLVRQGMMVLCLLLLAGFRPGLLAAQNPESDPGDLFATALATFTDVADRRTGSPGAEKAAEFIAATFEDLGLKDVGSQEFTLPVRRHLGSTLTLPEHPRTLSIEPLLGNIISPGTSAPPGLDGPLIYVGDGQLHRFNGQQIEDAIILMELDSGKGWQHAASLAAKALIYLDRGGSARALFEEKIELTPIDFPRFWLPLMQARELWGAFEERAGSPLAPRVVLTSEIRWEPAAVRNIYGLIPGRNPELSEEVVVVEAFYDAEAYVAGRSPGAGPALGAATLLTLAEFLRDHPPERAVVLVATAGHAQALAGMREMMYSVRARSRDLRKGQKNLKKIIKSARDTEKWLGRWSGDAAGLPGTDDPELDRRGAAAVGDEIKTRVDRIARELMQLRLSQKGDEHQERIKALAARRLELRRLGWRTQFTDLAPTEIEMLDELLPAARERQQAVQGDAQRRLATLNSTRAFRALVKERDLSAVVSLHLSSHGDGVGAFNRGWLHNLKSQIDRVAAYTTLDDALQSSAARLETEMGAPGFFKDTLRPSRLRAWDTYFVDRPALGGEVSSLAGYPGITLATTHDARTRWGTPSDTLENLDWEYARRQGRFVCALLKEMLAAPALINEESPRDGFAQVRGRVNFLRHGELFADQPAPGAMILAYQGLRRYYAMVDHLGEFQFHGVADKKHVLDKMIFEGYRFDPRSGQVLWAIDKKQTGKAAYRLKMIRKNMETDLIMFACRQTTLFNLLEPRNFHYLTKIQLLDGRREALPLRYWWSRIDTRSSTLASFYLDPGTRLKAILSDSVVRKKLILTNGTPEDPQGKGYRVDDWPRLLRTEYQVARDMWTLLSPRVRNLEAHGIYNARIRALKDDGEAALAAADQAFAQQQYDRFFEAATTAWALAGRVYDHVEKTQKDVLFGVLFYIALFVPFAFCAERLLFGFADIYKRLIAFITILLILIAVIYSVHPAFELAYSPTVVILAFFIIGLSVMVSLIIFFRFEAEMTLLQNRARPLLAGEISRFKTFSAAFFLGVSNLRRRRLRTALTCTTLVILTFTIMSFTSVKSTRLHTRLLYQPDTRYSGYLLTKFNWLDLPAETLAVIANAFHGKGTALPRVWLEDGDRTRPSRIVVGAGHEVYEAQGMLGLAAAEGRATGLESILMGGRWFADDASRSVLLPDRMARQVGIDPLHPDDAEVTIWGIPFKVSGVFDASRLQQFQDLNGEPLTPVTFPHEVSLEMTEIEAEALESGDDVRTFQSRYQHVPAELTVIVPYGALLAAGGRLKAVAVQPADGVTGQSEARRLVDRYGLTLYSGEPEGTFLYTASDSIKYSGMPNIVIPLAISIFIVLNTMIGSVYERKREIGIYTSVGLAPSHVSFLFVAEALAFAVLSVVLGYLVAQTAAGLLAGTALWSGITVNYSSLAGVAAMVLVILVVLVSVLYPSRVAANIAIPDVNRAWKLPAVKDNTMQLTLPFLMKYREIQSVAGFLLDYLKGHQDITHGGFSAGDISMQGVCGGVDGGPGNGGSRCPDGLCSLQQCLRIDAKIWLAPFDFGIMQQTAMEFCPAANEPGFLEIKIRLTREAGEANTWRRVNRTFLHALRKQLLIWRSLDAEMQNGYSISAEPEINA